MVIKENTQTFKHNSMHLQHTACIKTHCSSKSS